MPQDNRSKPKVLEADRAQTRFAVIDLESLISEDDSARIVWAFVERIDLTAFYAKIVSREGEVGRPAIDPKILLALWLQATLDGIGSARELSRRCEQHARYQWICGGVVPNYHTLSDFRSNSAAELDAMLTQSVAMLLSQGLVDMKRVAQDGMKVRASAGAGSFRSRKTLRQMARLAKEQVELLKSEVDEDPSAGKRREQAARERAARERLEKIERALQQMPEAERRKRSNNGKKKSEARVSTTDPEARVMKMADGGYRPSFNVQLATDSASQCVVGVDITAAGTDLRLAGPMVDQVRQRYGRTPDDWLVDGGYVHLEDIDHAAEYGCQVYAPPRKPRAAGHCPTEIRPGDSPAVAAWRTRMATEEGKEIYKERAATAELINAHARRRGLVQLLVRGVERVRSVVLLHALAQNLTRTKGVWAAA